MEDARIVELYWQRKEAAIRETDDRYGSYLTAVAYQILADRHDSEETVNDTYLRAWNTMPPHRPTALCAFLCKITRQLSIDRYRRMTAHKRQAARYTLCLEELSECVSGGERPEDSADRQLLAECISTYLRRLAPPAREAFLCRYFFADSLRDIAARQGTTVAQVKSMLHRTRQGLRDDLEKEGFQP